MNQQHQAKISWYKLLGASAIFCGTIGIVESRPANAIAFDTLESLESTQSIFDNKLEQPTGLTELDYSNLDNNTVRSIANSHRGRGRFGGHRGRRRFGGFQKKFFF